MRNTFAEINLSNLNRNYSNIRKKVSGSAVMAVVKADAYGHGMLKAVEAFESLGRQKPESYGVALLEEAVELRKSHLTNSPILNFAPIQSNEFQDYARYKITSTVSDFNHIKMLKKYSGKSNLAVHLNIDTGMGRLGIHYNEAVKFIRQLLAIPRVELTGVYTHFSTSDEKDKRYSLLQLKRFKNILNELNSLKIRIQWIHTANSGAILDLPDSYFNMVRPGISLYGYYPSQQTSESIKLKPVMSLFSEISTIKNINKGESVSYGRKFTAKNDTRIASVPIGYADGIERLLTNRMSVIIKNKFYKQIGTVTMDRILVDIGSDKLRPGDRVTLIGGRGNKKIDAWDWSNILGTIPYEVTCGINKRAPRIYV